MSDNHPHLHTLFAAAADDIPPGIDLLGGLRARQATRRVRGRAALAAAAACVVTAATVITLTIAQAPSALAQLTSAVSRTAGQSYRFSATLSHAPLHANGRLPAQPAYVISISGAFDPAQRVGEETISASGQIRFIGSYVYLSAGPIGGSALPGGKSWLKAPSPSLWAPVTVNQQLTVTAGLLSVAETSPQNLFTMLKSASTVDRLGSASGPGWTGTRYAFSVRIAFGPAGSGAPRVTATGTVDVDRQGRVRRLDAAFTQPGKAPVTHERAIVDMTFSDFGAPVSVSPPPASEVFAPANVQIQPGPAQ